MPLSLEFLPDDVAIWSLAGRELARYRARTEAPRRESPRPCLHPVFTLNGVPVTDFRPTDHPWHQGISWAFTYINGDTFWGGPTYRRETATYEWLDNHGRQTHLGWEMLSGSDCGLRQTVEWRSAADVVLLREMRGISARLVDGTGWALRFHSRFANVSGRELVCTSPVGEGRLEGGYFGLTWRGHPGWAHGKIFIPEGEVPSAMGLHAPWLAYEHPGAADREQGGAAVLLLRDDARNPRHPAAWFERHADQPLASFAFAYREPWHVGAGAEVELRHELLFFDGAWAEVSARLGLDNNK